MSAPETITSGYATQDPPASTTGAVPVELPTPDHPSLLNMIVTRRRQSVETVVVDGSGDAPADPEGVGSLPQLQSLSGNPEPMDPNPGNPAPELPNDPVPDPTNDPPSDPPDDPPSGPDPSYPLYPEVRALFITHDGGSLWVHRSAEARGAATVTLPWDARHRAGVQSDSIFFRIMHLLGAPLTAYARMGGRLHHAPLPLSNPRVETWTLMVDREAMDLAMGDPAADSLRSMSMRQPVWEWIPATARESEIKRFDQDGLAAWSELYNSDWYRGMSAVATQPPNPVPFPTPLPLPAPPQTSAPTAPPTPHAPAQRPAPLLTSVPAPTASAAPVTAPAPGSTPSVPPSCFPRPMPDNSGLSPGATPFVPRILRVPLGANLQASPDEIRQEHKNKEMVLKLVKGVNKFPRAATDTKSSDKDGLLAQLKHYSNSVRKIFKEAIVIEAMATPSCTTSVSEYQASVVSLLWNLKEHTLQDQQKRFLERAAGIFGSDQAWHQRYMDLDTLFSDLAKCSFSQSYLENAHGEAIAMKQMQNETAAEYFSRLETRMASVNFLAGRIPSCVEMTNLSILSTYRRGLKYATKVMRRLRALNLDVSKP
ncbi:hypothetical protein CYMTET_39878 [Cymbomonas tetramitiformis]|uniref:Retrotransposon gag domain-containing protein n=1 Tax=Cymbomonas tetramitiformis TaxID=36881 RepID=A0AAE0C993_9CHLO|nr:hypothetical protein CYMTET_39878 [Cymbomonas tetramitiformis]